MAFSVDGSKLARGGIDGHFRLFEWPTMCIIVDELKAHKSFRDVNFSLDSEFLASTSTDGAARIWNTKGQCSSNFVTKCSSLKMGQNCFCSLLFIKAIRH